MKTITISDVTILELHITKLETQYTIAVRYQLKGDDIVLDAKREVFSDTDLDITNELDTLFNNAILQLKGNEEILTIEEVATAKAQIKI